MDIHNNTILITGGGSGIGLELARRLLEKENKVLICGRSKKKLEQAQEKLPAIDYLQCDVSKPEDCQKLAEWIANEHPSCNVLINNAAIAHAGQFAGDKQAIEKAEAEVQTNLMAPIRLARLFLPILEKNSDPYIINVTTGLVYAPRAVYPYYNATKSALHSFTQVLRIQMAGRPVKVIEVFFPAVDTPWHKGDPPKIAIPVEKAVEEMIVGLSKGKAEIRIAGVKLLYILTRIAPGFALKKMNSLSTH